MRIFIFGLKFQQEALINVNGYNVWAMTFDIKQHGLFEKSPKIHFYREYFSSFLTEF